MAGDSENVELVRRAFQAFNDRDFDAMWLIWADDFLLRQIGGFAALSGAERRGADAREWLRDWIDTVGGRIEVESILEAEDQVLAIMNVAATGTASGAPATMRIGQVFSFRGGQISAVDSYYEASEALKAVGLSERDAQAESF
jgi:ketosteroid isomerase-like protein